LPRGQHALAPRADIAYGTTGSWVPCAMKIGVFALAGAASCAKLSASGR